MTTKLNELLEERAKLLEKFPALKEKQKEIDELLKDVIDPNKRLEILFFLISEKITELHNNFSELSKIIK